MQILQTATVRSGPGTMARSRRAGSRLAAMQHGNRPLRSKRTLDLLMHQGLNMGEEKSPVDQHQRARECIMRGALPCIEIGFDCGDRGFEFRCQAR